MISPYLNREARIPCITYRVHPSPQSLVRAEPQILYTGKRGDMQNIGHGPGSWFSDCLQNEEFSIPPLTSTLVEKALMLYR